jgi:starch phosphorylase
MKTCIANLTPRFGCGRMLAEYMSALYNPAHLLWQDISRNSFQLARNKTGWDSRINSTWNSIRFLELSDGPADQVMSGAAVPVKALIELAGLEPGDVRVEAVVGHIGVNGQLLGTCTLPLKACETRGTAVLFASEFTVQQTGRLGYSIRISPNHFDNPLTRPCNALLKWVSD